MGLDKSVSNAHKHAEIDWVIPLTISVLALGIMLAGEVGREWLRFDRVWIAEGESWRLITGHLSHLGWSHFILNAIGLGLVWFLVGNRFNGRDWFIVLASSVITMDLGFWLLLPQLHWYVGLSGLLHGLLVAGILTRFPKFDGESALLLALVVAKLVWEQFSGPLPGSETSSGGPVIVDAHLFGAVGGAVGAILARIRV